MSENASGRGKSEEYQTVLFDQIITGAVPLLSIFGWAVQLWYLSV